MDTTNRLSRMYALVAEMEAAKASIAAMQALNIEREQHNYSLAYDEGAFRVEQDKLEQIAAELRLI